MEFRSLRSSAFFAVHSQSRRLDTLAGILAQCGLSGRHVRLSEEADAVRRFVFQFFLVVTWAKGGVRSKAESRILILPTNLQSLPEWECHPEEPHDVVHRFGKLAFLVETRIHVPRKFFPLISGQAYRHGPHMIHQTGIWKEENPDGPLLEHGKGAVLGSVFSPGRTATTRFIKAPRARFAGKFERCLSLVCVMTGNDELIPIESVTWRTYYSSRCRLRPHISTS